MSNGLYQTEGIILNSADQGEADKVVTIFTKEFGMLRIFARGTRRASSKLNKFLNVFSYGRFGFVSGKDSWLLVAAQDLFHFDEIFRNRERLAVLGRMSRFIERLHHGEGEDPHIFALIKNAMEFLRNTPKEILEEFELVFFAKALALLGYLDLSMLPRGIEDLIEDGDFEGKLIIIDEEDKKILNEVIFEAIARSQL